MTAVLSEQTSSFDLQVFLLPYGNQKDREASLCQLQQSLGLLPSQVISPDQLEAFLLGNHEEQADRELSLQELEELRGGAGLVDAMVSSSILMLIVTQSAGLFGTSMSALNKSTLRDGINGAISADIELVRHGVANWAKEFKDGQVSYNPSTAACQAGTLGHALLTSSSLSSGTTRVSLTNAPTKLQGVAINRTVSVDPDNSNLIRISYATTEDSPINVNQTTTLASPAQGWCA